MAVWRNFLPYIFQGGLQLGSPSRRAAPGYLYDCQPLTCAQIAKALLKQLTMLLELLEPTETLSVCCCLMLQNIRWLQRAGGIRKYVYPKLFHVTCIAHLLHNCARSHFEDVDQLIAKVCPAISVSYESATVYKHIDTKINAVCFAENIEILG